MSQRAVELLEEAGRALDAGALSSALFYFEELERLEQDPEWARRAAQLHRQLGDRPGEVAALDRAAQGYEAAGEVLKAAVMCKLILRLDPGHAATLQRIPALVARRDRELGAARPTPDPAASERVNAAVRALYLRGLEGAVPSAEPAVHPVPLIGDAEAELDFEIMIEEPEPEPRPRTGESGPAAALAGTPFQELDPESFAELLARARLVELKSGAELFRQGDPGDALYVVASGTVGLIDEGPPRRGVAKLGERSVLGEIALLTDQPRTVTVTALQDSSLIALDRAAVKELTERDPRFLEILLRFLRDRLVDRLLATNPLFTVLSPRDRRALKGRFRLIEVDPGAVLIKEGERAPGLVILLSGRAQVDRQRAGATVPLAMLGPGDLAGEISLLTTLPAIATVRAAERCLAVQLAPEAFQKIIYARPQAMEFVQKLIEERIAQTKAALGG